MMENVKKAFLNNGSAIGSGESISPPTQSPLIIGAVGSTSAEPIPTMQRVTPHAGHRESIAMAASVGNSSVSPLVNPHLGSSFSPSSSLPPSPAASLGVQVPAALQGPSKRPLFLSHSLSRDGDAMRRMEEEEEKKKKQQQYGYFQDTKDSGSLGEKSKNIFSNKVMGMSPMGEVFGLPGTSPGGGRRETAHTMQRRKSSILPGSSMNTTSGGGGGGEKGGGETLLSFNTPLTSLPSHAHALRLSLGMSKNYTGNEGETHQDPQYALGALSSSAPTGVLGGDGKPFGASPLPWDGSPAAAPFMNSNYTEGRLSGGGARMGGMMLGGSYTQDGHLPSFASRMPLGDANHPVEFPMRLRRGPGLSTSPSAVSGGSGSDGGAGSNLPSPLILSGFNNLKRVDDVWGTAEDEGSSSTTCPLLVSEDATAEDTKIGTGLVSRGTLHTHLREEAAAAAATVMGMATPSAVLAESQQVDEKGEIPTTFYPPMEAEEEEEAEQLQRKTEQIPALFCSERRKNENVSLVHDRQYLPDGSEKTLFSSSSSAGEPAAQKKQKREQTGKSLLISYWKSKHAFQLNKHGLKDPDSIHNSYYNNNNSGMMVGGYSAPVGFDGLTPAKEHYAQFSSALPQLKEERAEGTQKQQQQEEEEEEEEEEKSGAGGYPRRVGEVASVDVLSDRTETPSDRWVGDGVYATGQGHTTLGSGLGMGDVGRFSLATSVPAFFRVRSSGKKNTNQHSVVEDNPNSGEEEASMGRATNREKRNSEVLLAMSSSPSLGMTPKRTTLHAVLRDGLPADAGASNSDFTEAVDESTGHHMANQRNAVVAPASALSFNQASGGRTERRHVQASELNVDEYETGEYAT